jgi:hypothetical protein
MLGGEFLILNEWETWCAPHLVSDALEKRRISCPYWESQFLGFPANRLVTALSMFLSSGFSVFFIWSVHEQ